jgi:hypothetical protein
MLTVDWDFFVPEDPLVHDFGHAENALYHDWIWDTRAMYIDDIKTTGQERTFWSDIQKHNTIATNKVVVSDSHIHAYEVAVRSGFDTIVSIDAHHDCWPFKVSEAGAEYDCGSWLRWWLENDHAHEAHWICADYTQGAFGHGDEHERAYEVKGIEKLDNVVFAAVHVCRSGCWTPPWLDHRFVSFVERGKFEYVETMGHDGDTHQWDPMQPRWSRQEISRAREENVANRGRVKEMRERIDAVRAARREREEA